ncbi:hypothetical protein WOLCODRAFT_142007 [Wolfiporia cocos MD-104 SS10]|uniref:Uncharacterized protein n=1 Tax=Wolfiporia cocos (strain MD-104) TaxID=742152 RepID=A0A2H3IWQ8_WOLCO|nr:hypothetical protein WOLCODRAFT_142007 [Wolfiporia cocos MD-104 SS10]
MFAKIFVPAILLLASANSASAIVYRRQHDFAHEHHGLEKAKATPTRASDARHYVVHHPTPVALTARDDSDSGLSGLVSDLGGVQGIEGLVEEIISALPSDLAAPASSLFAQVTSALGGSGSSSGLVTATSTASLTMSAIPTAAASTGVNGTSSAANATSFAAADNASGLNATATANSTAPSTAASFASAPTPTSTGELDGLFGDIDEAGQEAVSIIMSLMGLLPTQIASPVSSVVSQATATIASDFDQFTQGFDQGDASSFVVTQTVPVSAYQTGSF